MVALQRLLYKVSFHLGTQRGGLGFVPLPPPSVGGGGGADQNSKWQLSKQRILYKVSFHLGAQRVGVASPLWVMNPGCCLYIVFAVSCFSRFAVACVTWYHSGICESSKMTRGEAGLCSLWQFRSQPCYYI